MSPITLLLRDIKQLITMDPQLGDISNAAVFVEDNLIAWVGQSSSIPPQYQEADTVLSLPTHLIHPGLINTHHHMYQHLTRAVAPVSLR
jgi:cytosine/adenosine deaminase-related metal-dependent hydrolase